MTQSNGVERGGDLGRVRVRVRKAQHGEWVTRVVGVRLRGSDVGGGLGSGILNEVLCWCPGGTDERYMRMRGRVRGGDPNTTERRTSSEAWEEVGVCGRRSDPYRIRQGRRKGTNMDPDRVRSCPRAAASASHASLAGRPGASRAGSRGSSQSWTCLPASKFAG